MDKPPPENPYSPNQHGANFPPQPGQPGHPYYQPAYSQAPGYRPGSGYVGQVRTVAILMIVLGSLELLAGLAAAGVAFIPLIVVQVSGEEFMPDHVMMAVFYGITGVVFLIVGGIRLYAGIRNYHFKSRTLGIASHFLGFLTLVSCQCSMLAIGLAIFGLIVYFQSAVAVAFDMRKRGTSAEQVIAFFRQANFPYQGGQQMAQQPAQQGGQRPVKPHQ